MNIMRPEKVTEEAANAEAKVQPEEPVWAECTAWDDVSGLPLDPQRVAEARRLEMDYYKIMEVYDKVPLSEFWEKTGRGPLKARWIDIDKGTRYRSRWVAKQFKNSDVEEWFAATPPIEALRMVVSAATSGPPDQGLKVMGVSRAFF